MAALWKWNDGASFFMQGIHAIQSIICRYVFRKKNEFSFFTCHGEIFYNSNSSNNTTKIPFCKLKNI